MEIPDDKMRKAIAAWRAQGYPPVPFTRIGWRIFYRAADLAAAQEKHSSGSQTK
jgi:hypothetical protein